MRTLPSGTVTLLFTDIEGSTRLLDDLGDRYPAALAGHRRTLRMIFDRSGGIEVDTQGDAFFVVFPSAADALEAAGDVHDALAREGPIRVRIGIHTGEPVVADDGYVGIDVHRAARVAAAAHGGQTILSQATRELVDMGGLLDLGRHRLKDVGELRLYQIGGARFPPLRSMSQTNMTSPATPLVGRTRELADLVRLLGDDRDRVVTIVGPGGVGKTRLATEVAVALQSRFDDGAWFVDLAAVRDRALVLPAIAAAIGAAGDLAEHLCDRAALLVLDNMEQVVDVAPDVARLVDRCPRVFLLATSREPLRVRAEREYRLAPLADAAAVELFRQRAAAVDPSFDASAGPVHELCERLDRIPLAIELAAARIRILSVEQLLARLDRLLPMLTGGARDAPERQRTLRATIEWSFDLLSAGERRLLARLGVFAGGWTLEAGERVCAADPDALQSLVDKSLVRSEFGRFRMLETIREYACEHLEATGEAEQVRDAHAAYFLAWAETAERELTGTAQHVWLERLAVESQNLSAALDRYTTTDDAEGRGLRLASALVLFWFVRGFYTEGLRWLERTLERSDRGPRPARAGALWGAGFFHALLGAGDRARALLEESLALSRELDDASRAARALSVLGLLAFFRNDARAARALLEEGAALAREADDLWCLADALGTLSSIYPLQGEMALAEAAGRQGLAIARRCDDRQGIRMALFGLALTAVRAGDLEAARTAAVEGLAVSREIGDLWFVSYFRWILATVATASREWATARAHAEEALAVARRIEGPLLIVCALDALAAAARGQGDDVVGRALLEEAEAVGRTASVPDSYLAQVLCGLGELALARGDIEEAARLVDESFERAHAVFDTWAADRAIAARAALAARRDQNSSHPVREVPRPGPDRSREVLPGEGEAGGDDAP